jgi:hypothetical protein
MPRLRSSPYEIRPKQRSARVRQAGQPFAFKAAVGAYLFLSIENSLSPCSRFCGDNSKFLIGAAETLSRESLPSIASVNGLPEIVTDLARGVTPRLEFAPGREGVMMWSPNEQC